MEANSGRLDELRRIARHNKLVVDIMAVTEKDPNELALIRQVLDEVEAEKKRLWGLTAEGAAVRSAEAAERQADAAVEAVRLSKWAICISLLALVVSVIVYLRPPEPPEPVQPVAPTPAAKTTEKSPQSARAAASRR